MSTQAPGRAARIGTALVRWIDSSAGDDERDDDSRRIDWVRVVPFAALHLACVAVIWVGWSWTAVLVAVGLYVVRMFAITGVYHRLFSHRAYTVNRFWQFCLALLGCSAVQRGPLWWAAHHRHHHRHSDQEPDVHSPWWHGFFWSHIGWILSRYAFRTRIEEVRDLARFRELRVLDRFDVLVPALLGGALWGAGALLEARAPQLGTSGAQLFVWGFCISTVVLFHATSAINSIAHAFGRRMYETGDESRNSFLLALVTLGEGWHNNHHRYPGAVRQGFRWWQIDVTWYVLTVLSWIGVVRDMRTVPPEIVRAAGTELS